MRNYIFLAKDGYLQPHTSNDVENIEAHSDVLSNLKYLTRSSNNMRKFYNKLLPGSEALTLLRGKFIVLRGDQMVTRDRHGTSIDDSQTRTTGDHGRRCSIAGNVSTKPQEGVGKLVRTPARTLAKLSYQPMLYVGGCRHDTQIETYSGMPGDVAASLPHTVEGLACRNCIEVGVSITNVETAVDPVVLFAEGRLFVFVLRRVLPATRR